jgi:hypothetical protein
VSVTLSIGLFPFHCGLELDRQAHICALGQVFSVIHHLYSVISYHQMSQTAAATGALDPTLFAGVLDIIQPQAPDDLQEMAVTDDLDGEGETVAGLNFEDGNLDALHVSDLLKTVNDVSKGVSERTHDEYKRYVLFPPAGHAHC